MIEALLDVDLLLISDDRWSDAEERDSFISLLNEHCEYIEKINNIKIIWSHDLDDVIYSAPQFFPWSHSDDISNQFMPVIYKTIISRLDHIDISCCSICCAIPNLKCDYNSAKDVLLKMISRIIFEEKKPVFCLGLNNLKENNFEFTCSSTSACISPLLLREPKDWLSAYDIETIFWPKVRNDIENFKTCIILVAERDYSNRIINTFDFTPKFIADVKDVTDNSVRKQISNRIAKRLTLTSLQAQSDSQLQDEFVHSSKEQRFRVSSGSTQRRIHYTFDDKKKIVFERYYPEGHHDDGLKN